MFKYNNTEDEIYQSMAQKLSSFQLENKYNFNKLARVTKYLNAASEIFDKAGMHVEAAEVINILQKIVIQLRSKQ